MVLEDSCWNCQVGARMYTLEDGGTVVAAGSVDIREYPGL